MKSIIINMSTGIFILYLFGVTVTINIANWYIAKFIGLISVVIISYILGSIIHGIKNRLIN